MQFANFANISQKSSLRPGPVYDVVMTRKDDSWLVLIDTSECGKLEEGVRLRPFRETGDVAHLTQEVRAANEPRKI